MNTDKRQWSMLEFQNEIFGKRSSANVVDYIQEWIDRMQLPNHFGNEKVYIRCLRSMHTFDPELAEINWAAMDLYWVNEFNA